MRFERYEACEEVRPLVAYYWSLKSEPSDSQEGFYRFIPDGFTDWVFHLGAPWSFRGKGKQHFDSTASAHCFGQLGSYVDLILPESELELFAVKFHPWVGKAVHGQEMHLLSDGWEALSGLQSGLSGLSRCIRQAESTLERIQLAESFILRERLNNSSQNEVLRMEQLYRQTHDELKGGRVIGCRRLQQLFRSEIGLGFKSLQQIQRVNSSISILRDEERRRVNEHLQVLDYYDQSHFNREFKQYTGLRPRQFLESIAPSGDILNLRLSA